MFLLSKIVKGLETLSLPKASYALDPLPPPITVGWVLTLVQVIIYYVDKEIPHSTL